MDRGDEVARTEGPHKGGSDLEAQSYGEEAMKTCRVCKGMKRRLVSLRPPEWKRCTSCAGRGVKGPIGCAGPELFGGNPR